jgi:hypothetical protein
MIAPIIFLLHGYSHSQETVYNSVPTSRTQDYTAPWYTQRGNHYPGISLPWPLISTILTVSSLSERAPLLISFAQKFVPRRLSHFVNCREAPSSPIPIVFSKLEQINPFHPAENRNSTMPILPPELWIMIFDMVIIGGIVRLDQCDHSTFLYDHVFLSPGQERYRFYRSYCRLRLVCRSFNTHDHTVICIPRHSPFRRASGHYASPPSADPLS